jgi:hypothetical protein
MKRNWKEGSDRTTLRGKFPRHSPFVLLVKVDLKEEKALGTGEMRDENWTLLGLEQIKEFEEGLTAFERNFELRYCPKNVKQSRYTPWRRLGGEEV